MPRTRSKVKEEPMDNTAMYGAEGQASASESQSAFAAPPSSGSTFHNDDTNMTNGHGQHNTAPAPSVPTFAQDARSLIKTIQNLDALGIDATLPSLPKIVVVGDQSHGKSSVIEAICEVSLPRDAGTCTRCPFEVITTASRGWTCKISLVCKYEYYAQARGGQPKWAVLPTPEIIAFATLRDKDELEQTLRLAQLAILNPHLDPAIIFQEDNTDIGAKVGFSPNIVRLEIAAPDLPELSLYDLPGAINITEKPEDQHLVTFVQKLIENYVRDDKAIVLLTAAANADVELSKSFNIVRERGASPRCIGVITKPDLIDATAVPRIRQMLNDEIWTLGHGWYVTRQLSQDELVKGTSYEAARELERALFAREPWCDLAFNGRFGVQQLQDAVSRKLTAHIRAELPEIKHRVQTKLNEVQAQLANFPEKSGAPCMEVFTEVQHVAKIIIDNIHGGVTMQNDFRNAYKGVIKDLASDLRQARPSLNVATPGYRAPAIMIDSDDDTATMKSPTPAPRPTPNSKSRKGNDGRAIPTPSSSDTSSSVRPPVKKETGANATASTKSVFTLDQIRDAFESGNNSGLPDGLSPFVKERLGLQCLEGVPSIVNKALGEVKSLMLESLEGYIQSTLATRRGTDFLNNVSAITEKLFMDLFQDTEKAINVALACEMHKPFVTDVANMHAKQNARKAELTGARNFRRVNEHFDTLNAKTGKDSSREERKKLAEDKKRLEDKLGVDPQADMIEAILQPFAYYDVAANRIVDTVKLRLEYELLHTFTQRVRQTLLDGLHYKDAAYCATLLAEEPAREQLRRKLLTEEAKLVQALKELQERDETDA